MSKYRVFVRPRAWKESKALPGNIRQRVWRAFDAFANEPRPDKTKTLKTSRTTLEVRRLRLDDWRIVYAINEELEQVQVLTVQRRPPYDYSNLEELLSEVE